MARIFGILVGGAGLVYGVLGLLGLLGQAGAASLDPSWSAYPIWFVVGGGLLVVGSIAG